MHVIGFEQMWSELVPVGRVASGGYQRLAFTPAEEEAHSWFLDQCRRRDLRVEEDTFGNVVAWWDVGGSTENSPRRVDASSGARPLSSVHNPALQVAGDVGGDVGGGTGVVTGSHLDSVADGGAYDGPLGVVSALAAVDGLRDRGFAPVRPIGVSVFRAEEGSRFPVACLGSRLATGATSWAEAGELRDPSGATVADTLGDGLDDRTGGPGLLADVGTFVELHVEQGRHLVDLEESVGVATSIWPHGRYRFTFTGEANHAGTTRMEDRHDPMLTYAMTVLAAHKQARLAADRATFGRVMVEPNGTNAVPQRVTGWLDARASSTESLLRLVADVERMAVDRGGRDGTDVVVTPESVTTEVRFDPDLAGRLARLGPADGWPVLPTAAGHDAGILSSAGIPTAMLFVRNPTGISHSPFEHAPMADCLAGVEALTDVLELLAGESS